jgi:adenine deaminase
MADYTRLLRVARGEEPADLVVQNGLLVNVLTREIYPATVGICEDVIAYVTAPDDAHCAGREVIDATGKWLAPGLIDSHMHIESSHVTPARFADAVLPLGVTTVAQDPHEMANVLGIAGVDYMREASRNLPLRVLTFVPTCVPAVPGLETAGASFTATEVGQLLDDPDTIGLAEVMDYWGVVRQSPRITEIVKLGRERGAILTGHVRFGEDRNLNAYLAAGIESDHGRMPPERLLARARLGMVVEVCCAPDRDNIPEIVELWREHGLLHNVIFVTDDISPGDLITHGHLDQGVRRAIELGMDPVDAIRAATAGPARRLRRNRGAPGESLGAIAPGYLADLLVLDDLSTFSVHLTVVSGRIVARDGEMVTESHESISPPSSALSSFHLPTLQADDFAVRGPGETVRARVITDRGKGLDVRTVPVTNGNVDWQSDPDLALVSVWHRHGHNENHAFALIAGTGLRTGALATTYAHDSHNLVVIGRNTTDMATAANALRSSGGGYVAVSGGKILGQVALPVAGLLSQLSVPEVAGEFASYVAAANAVGVVENPIRLVTSLPLPVVPNFRPTDLGLVDVSRQTFVPAFEFSG